MSEADVTLLGRRLTALEDRVTGVERELTDLKSEVRDGLATIVRVMTRVAERVDTLADEVRLARIELRAKSE